MSRTDAYLLIFGMAAVTYIPRALPAFLSAYWLLLASTARCT